VSTEGVSYRILRSLLFRLDAEAAHDLVVSQMRRLQEVPLALRTISGVCSGPADPIELWGIRFRNRFGIAAGFDKNGELVPMLEALGFGFVEIGTVTPRPQPGNPRPRMVRLPESGALINRMGFNNEGAAAVAERLRNLERTVPLLVNIGKNRDVPIERAAADYAAGYAALAAFADAVVINVSSPNTPGLRDLQDPEQIGAVLSAVRSAGPARPLLVKIAPDLDLPRLRELVDVCRERADGLIATNTTVSREGLGGDPGEAGGLSGRPLFARSTEVLRAVREQAGPRFPLIGVGGIMSPADALGKIEAGADLLQTYTGFIYGGPLFARRILTALRSSSKL
jgi:dihydroorotate dehydrogenase